MASSWTSLERFEAAINFESCDRIPLGYLQFGAGNAVLHQLGCRLRDVYYTADGIVKAQLKTRELFGHDNVMSPWGCYTVEGEALGSEIRIKENDYPMVDDHPLRSKEDIDSLEVPDPYRAGRMPMVLESLTKFVERVGREVFVIGFVSSPFAICQAVRGAEAFIVDTISDRQLAHDLMEKVTQTCIEFGKAMAEVGVHAVMSDRCGWGMLGSQLEDEFLFQYAKKMRDAVKAEGIYYMEYSSGVPDLEKEMELSPDVLGFNIGEVEAIKEKHGIDCEVVHKEGCDNRVCIREMRDRFSERGKRIALMGNVDHTTLALTASPQEIEREVGYCIQALGGDKTGFILSSGGEMPFSTKEANMKAMLKAVERIGCL